MKNQIVKLVTFGTTTILFLGLAVLPLIIWPRAKIPYEIPRVWFIQRWIEVLGVMGLLGSVILLKPKKIDGYLLFLMLGFVGIAIIASILGVDLGKSIWGNYYRGDGLMTLFHLAGLSIFVVLFWQRSWEKRTAQAIGLGVLMVSFWTLILAFRLFILGDRSVDIWGNGTIGASFGNPNFLAGFLVVTLPLIMYLINKSPSRCPLFFIWVMVLILQFLAIMVTNSWGGVVGSILSIVGWISISSWRWEKRSYLKAIGAISLISLIGLIGWLYIRQYQSLGFVAEGRERIVRRILLGVAKRPLLGYGFANTDYAFEKVAWPISLEHDVYVDKAHSQLLEVLATTGIAGLLIYIGLIGRIGILLIRWVKKEDKYNLWPKTLLLAFLLYIFHSQTNIISIGEEVIFWLVAGIAAGEA